MRALSVKQPFAELIASGRKKSEYRSWKCDHRGDLLIVASASRNDAECRRHRIDPDAVAYGVAVCVVDLWKTTGDEWTRYSWHVRNPRRVVPIPIKGFASIYTVDAKRLRFADGEQVAEPEPCKPKPKVLSKAKRSTVKSSSRERQVERGSVLLAVRNDRLRSHWTRALEAMGYSVTAHRDGFAAWRAIHSLRPSCLVISEDVQGMPAIVLIRRLQSERAFARIPIVFGGPQVIVKDWKNVIVPRSRRADSIVDAVTSVDVS